MPPPTIGQYYFHKKVGCFNMVGSVPGIIVRTMEPGAMTKNSWTYHPKLHWRGLHVSHMKLEISKHYVLTTGLLPLWGIWNKPTIYPRINATGALELGGGGRKKKLIEIPCNCYSPGTYTNNENSIVFMSNKFCTICRIDVRNLKQAPKLAYPQVIYNPCIIFCRKIAFILIPNYRSSAEYEMN